MIDLVGLDGLRRTATPTSCPAACSSASGWPGRWPSTRRCMFFDEPFTALDPLIRRDMQNEVIRLHHEVGKTMVFITHDLAEALKLGDRIVIMRDGADRPDRPARGARRRPGRRLRRATSSATCPKSHVLTLRWIMREPTPDDPLDGPEFPPDTIIRDAVRAAAATDKPDPGRRGRQAASASSTDAGDPARDRRPIGRRGSRWPPTDAAAHGRRRPDPTHLDARTQPSRRWAASGRSAGAAGRHVVLRRSATTLLHAASRPAADSERPAHDGARATGSTPDRRTTQPGLPATCFDVDAPAGSARSSMAFLRPSCQPAIGWLGVTALVGRDRPASSSWLADRRPAGRRELPRVRRRSACGSASMDTLALTLAAVVLSLVIGIPLGIVAGATTGFLRLLTPVLDVMQTMPTFAYLAPLTLFFLIGAGVGGHRHADLRDAAGHPDHRARHPRGRPRHDRGGRVAGLDPAARCCARCSCRWPGARSCLGINQTIMMALSMVDHHRADRRPRPRPADRAGAPERSTSARPSTPASRS